MNFLNHLKKLSPAQLQELRQNLHIVQESLLDIYAAFTSFLDKNLLDYISQLSSEETELFFLAVKKNGFELENLDKTDLTPYRTALAALEKKALAYSTRSVQKIKPSTRIFIFEEILELLQKKAAFHTYEQIAQKIKSIRLISIHKKYHEMPYDLFAYFLSFGFICKKEFIIQQFGEPAIKYFLEEGVVRESLVLFNQDNLFKLVPCYEIDLKKVQNNTYDVIRSISYHTRIFNDIIKLIYLITKDDILITKKGEINKKHYEKLLKEIQSENILFFLIRFFTRHSYIETDQKRGFIQLTKKGYDFFKQDIQDVYEKLLETDPELKQVFSVIQKIGAEEFGLADIIFHAVKDNFETNPALFLSRETRRKILQITEILTYMGILIQKYTAEGFTLYQFNPRYKNLLNEQSAHYKPLVLSPALEVTVYPNELDLQTSYILNLFMEIEQFSDLIVYSISPKSIRRAIYFKLPVEDFIKTLTQKSRNGLPDNVLNNIKRWQNQYKEGVILNRILIQASKDIIDQLTNDPAYQSFIIKRISDQHAIVTKDIYKNRILEEIGIFFTLETDLDQ